METIDGRLLIVLFCLVLGLAILVARDDDGL